MFHYVIQGEHLSRIAQRFGFSNYQTIWNHPENAELKSKRKTPNILLPGDKLFIPHKSNKELDRSTDQTHLFKRMSSALKLLLRISSIYSGPLANTKCELQAEGIDNPITTDGGGRLEQQIEENAEKVMFIVNNEITVENHNVVIPLSVELLIGHLDPIDEASGQLGRLMNLGYYRSSILQVDNRELNSAIEEFQCDYGLTVDGICGSRTQAKLKEVHGC